MKNSSRKGVKEGETRATFIITIEQLESIKAISYWERKTIKEIISEALKNYLDKIENKIQKRK